ncbi:DUF1996 domain-containing protein [Streptomyces sp. MBT49]|uniref:DUF1996 domain-containing protein n=1 Tax=Streptomyces sp. MBT49 TaxID=1488380 RepID=UPI00190A85E6|nr:DUF1996 domain-containing protein [Streptomyces sp. MBT49]MBK3624547.1 DUF1996 domain-containing protein [Streptomyces sp. MBT49]
MRADHRRGRSRRNALVAVTALLAGGGGLVAVNYAANASDVTAAAPTTRSARAISCPDVKSKLPAVPRQAQDEVERNLELLDRQTAEAGRRLAETRGQGGPDFIQNAILGPLADKRKATIDRISIAIGRSAAEPTGLDGLAACDLGLAAPGTQPSGAGAGAGQQGNDGPTAADFVDITKVAPNVRAVRRTAGASTGAFTSRCGTNERGQHNSDNDIVAPGVSNGAHHVHDYVGNKKVDFNSTNESLSAQRTTCTNGDQSAYYWPVLRDTSRRGPDANALGGGAEGNRGAILVPSTVTITYQGSPTGKVVAMPRFLRIITGDAKAFTNGTKNANAHWSCTGFENKVQLTDKYPICPRGSKVVRSFAFQSCWDGSNTDSADHRSHVAFPDARGNCAEGFKAVPRLTMRLVYKTPAAPNFAVDGFQGQQHNAITDHNDFINVMSDRLMRQAVSCINSGRRCG